MFLAKLSDGASLLESGAPELQKYGRSIIIPDQSEMHINILSSEYVEYDNIRFTVIEGPTYFGDSYVIHSPSNNQSPYDLSYIFNNNLVINV